MRSRRSLLSWLFSGIALGLLLVAGAPRAAAGSAPLSLGLLQALGRPGGAPVHAWVYFADKGLADPELRARALDRVEASLPAHALWRRSKTMPGRVVDELDLPVSESYLEQVLATGARRREVSRWLDAVSVAATPAQLTAIAALPCVARLDLVGAYRRDERRLDALYGPEPVWTAPPAPAAPSAPLAPAADSTQYGMSWSQLNQIQIPQLHDAGFHGEGILICMLDDGFRLNHAAFNYPGHPIQVAHSRDFIYGDSIVADQAGQDSAFQDEHGTWTLSTIGAYYPGQFLGAAYNARFILGKTEWIPTEYPIEEDHWLAGAEWADSLGADVISSSLGYRDFDTSSISPLARYMLLDGHTHVTTRAASIASRHGIVVVDAMGNENGLGVPYPSNKMIAPADGDSVLSVGAVNSAGTIAAFSSLGPTWDRRLKPDIVARGVSDWMVGYSDPNGYEYHSGTSFSTPLTAGAVALILQKHPDYTPLMVLEAIHQTGSQAANPDTVYGYGLLRAYDAANYNLAAVDSGGGVRNLPGLSLALSLNRPNPFRGLTVLDYTVSGVAGSQRVRLRVFDVSGRAVATLKDGDASPGTHQASWDGRDGDGRPLGTGVYFCRLESGSQAATRRIVLLR
ncbi:MAG TPA: S8 family serine peptidase [Candidatus Saccharimonadales bacterium]|nr:S8 family serine peptidase [Candidatus Saccharimonadales bacterium]